MKQEPILDVMENLNVKDAYILGFESDGNIDSIFLSITAEGKNYKVNDQTKTPSYPYIVLKMDYMDKQVIFE